MFSEAYTWTPDQIGKLTGPQFWAYQKGVPGVILRKAGIASDIGLTGDRGGGTAPPPSSGGGKYDGEDDTAKFDAKVKKMKEETGLDRIPITSLNW